MSMDVAVSFGAAFNFAKAKNSEDEVKQGKSYYQSAGWQILETYNFSTIVDPLTDFIPNPHLKTAAKVCNQIVPIFSVAACPLFAVSRQGHYPQFASTVNSFIKPRCSILQLPEKLDSTTTNIFNFMAEHTGDIVSVGMLATCVALPILSCPYIAGAVIAPVMYQAADSRNYIPHRISLVVETYLPVAINASLLIGGNLLNRIISVASFLSYIPCFGNALQHKLDDYNQHYSGLKGPRLKELDAELVQERFLKYDAIMEILEGSDDDFELNPAHFTKSVASDIIFRSHRNIDTLLKLFDRIDWTTKVHVTLVQGKLYDDERFLDYLKNRLGAQHLEFLKEKKANQTNKSFNDENKAIFQQNLANFAKANNVTIAQVLLTYLRIQVVELVGILKKEKPITGSRIDLEEAVSIFQEILGYYLKHPQTTVDFVDDLLKMAIEAGTYCARALLRTFKEIHEAIRNKNINSPTFQMNPMKSYELNIMYSLQKTRANTVDAFYQKYIELHTTLLKGQLDHRFSFNSQTIDASAVAIAQDIHTADLQRKYFAFGFIPMSKRERNSFNTMDLFMWGNSSYLYGKIREMMTKMYFESIEGVIKEHKMLNFASHIRSLILSNPNLKTDEKDQIIEFFILNEWGYEATQHRFMRLLFCMLGILRPTSLKDSVFVERPDSLPSEVELQTFPPASPTAASATLEADIKLEEDSGSDWIVAYSSKK